MIVAAYFDQQIEVKKIARGVLTIAHAKTAIITLGKLTKFKYEIDKIV